VVHKHAIADSLHALAACERTVFGRPAKAQRFYRLGRVFLSEAALRRHLPQHESAQMETLRHLLGPRVALLQRFPRLFGRCHDIESTASAIVLKSNVRGFYFSDGATLKVANPRLPLCSARLAEEPAIRKKIVNGAVFTVPDILGQGTCGEVAYLLERTISGARTLQAADISTRFAESLVEFQRVNRVPDPSPQNAHSLDAFKRAFSSAVSGLGLVLPGPLKQVLAPGYQPDFGPRSICHGDLTRTNIIASGGKCFIVDWEFGKEAPAAFDAVRLATQFDHFASLYVQASGGEAARRWLLAGCMMAITDRYARFNANGEEGDKHTSERQRTRQKCQLMLDVAVRAV
jgi:hypothetical protein